MSFRQFRRYIQALGGDAPRWEGPWPEEQRGDYEAATVRLDSQLWRIRSARLTPSKPGAFVAVWERDEMGATRPFASDDPAVGLLVFVEEEHRCGVFRFSASHLEDLGVTRGASRPGKRGFRVYPCWVAGLNAQASRSQEAQASAFSIWGP